MPGLPLSIQLYTVRDHTAKDFAGTVKRLADIGFKGVELAGYGNLKSAGEVRKALDAAGLVVSGAHTGIDGLLTDPGKVAEEQKILGNPHVICPWAPLDNKPESEYLAFAQQLEKAGAAAVQHGLTLAYHNHSFEYKPFGKKNGKTYDGLDIIFQNTKPDHVKAELDLFWVAHGGHNPAPYIQALGSRTILVHLKDMQVGPDRRFANVGEGIMDWKTIIPAAQKVGVRWYVVEQDDCYGQDPLDAARISFENLKRMGYA